MERTQVVNKIFVGMQWSMVAGLIALLGGACDDKKGREQAQPAQPAQTAQTPRAEVGQVTDDPMRFRGKRVQLNGEIARVYGPRAFALEGEGVWWDDEILVVTRVPVTIGGSTLTEDDEVRVAGTVKTLTVAEVERDLGWDLEEELEVKFRDKPVLVADTIRVSDAEVTWSEKEHPQSMMVGLMRLWTASDPSQLAGQTLTVSNVPVRRETGKAMWIGYNDLAQVLVVPNDAATLEQIEEGERVTISGTVEKMPPVDQARRLWNLPQELQAQLGKELVYINATRVEEAAPGKMTMNFHRKW